MLWEDQDVTEAVKVSLYPTGEQKSKINQNIGNRGFIWNKMLGKIKHEKVKPTKKNLNKILKELTIQYPFLKNSESSSQTTSFLLILYKHIINIKKEGVGFPKFKSQKKTKISHLEYRQTTITSD